MVGKFAIQEEVSSRVELEQGRRHLNVFAEVGKSGGKKEGQRERERKENCIADIVSHFVRDTSGSISLPVPKTRIFQLTCSAASSLGGAK